MASYNNICVVKARYLTIQYYCRQLVCRTILSSLGQIELAYVWDLLTWRCRGSAHIEICLVRLSEKIGEVFENHDLRLF